MRRLLLAPLLAAGLGGAAEDVLAGIAPHPRLFLRAEEVATLQMRIDGDPRFAALVERLHAHARSLAAEPLLTRDLVGTKRFRLLDTSRECLRRVLAWGVSLRLRPNPVLRDRLIAELENVCAFSDWHPQHFLDTAEMAAAVAIGYDWLHADLDAATRDRLRQGLVTLGLRPSLEMTGFWVSGNNNWNQVCHGGSVLGALAVAEDEGDLARALVSRALRETANGLHAYAPLGVYPEGPGYWSYGTAYTVLTAAALTSALGQDGGLANAPGFRESFTWIDQVRGPIDLVFNYADGSPRAPLSPWHAWAARAWDQPDLLAGFHVTVDRILAGNVGDRFWPLAVLWYAPPSPGTPPATSFIAGEPSPVQVALLRSGHDQEASFVGLKGGKLRINHGHLDVGSFVFDALGERWAHDFPAEREIYDRLDSWGTDQESRRWTYFRANNHGHNTLSIGGAIQRVEGSNPIIASHADEGRAHAVVDLGSAYAGQAEAVSRGAALVGGRRCLLLRDEITKASGTVRWTLITRAEVTITDGTATMTQNGRTLILRLVNAPPQVQIAVLDCTPPTEVENPNDGFRRICIDIADPPADLVLSVALISEGCTLPADADRPLADWR